MENLHKSVIIQCKIADNQCYVLSRPTNRPCERTTRNGKFDVGIADDQVNILAGLTIASLKNVIITCSGARF